MWTWRLTEFLTVTKLVSGRVETRNSYLLILRPLFFRHDTSPKNKTKQTRLKSVGESVYPVKWLSLSSKVTQIFGDMWNSKNNFCVESGSSFLLEEKKIRIYTTISRELHRRISNQKASSVIDSVVHLHLKWIKLITTKWPYG